MKLVKVNSDELLLLIFFFFWEGGGGGEKGKKTWTWTFLHLEEGLY